jgi:hypothetical protein
VSGHYAHACGNTTSTNQEKKKDHLGKGLLWKSEISVVKIKELAYPPLAFGLSVYTVCLQIPADWRTGIEDRSEYANVSITESRY